MKEHAQQHPREGSRKAGAALRRRGTRVNHKKVERLWRRHDLTVPVKRRQRRRGKGLDRPLTPLYPNRVWAYEFMEDACVGGRKLRILTIVDEFTREGLETYVDYSIPAAKVIEVLEFLFLLHGGPASAPMVGQRSGCVPAEPYPLADRHRVIERQRKARDSDKIVVEVGNPNN
jgi:putative transposase